MDRRRDGPGPARRRSAGLLLWVGLVVVASLVPTTGVDAREPWLPTDDSQVLTRLPVGAVVRDQTLVALREAARREPGQLRAALALADHYLAIGRARQDSRFMGYAQAALAAWWSLPAPPLAVRLVRADTMQHRHDFVPALTELDQVLIEAPRHPRAILARAQILMVLGRPHEAMTSCAGLVRIADPLVVATCSASAMALSGRGETGARLLEASLLRAHEAPAVLRAWSLGALGEIQEGSGRSDRALEAYRAARNEYPADVWVAGALADLHLVRGEVDRAIATIGTDLESDGQLLRLALARKAGQGAVAPLRAMLEDRFAASAARGDSIAQREEARFRLELTDEPARALLLAKANWRRQREVEDARLLLAAAHRAREPTAARPVLEWIAQTGIVDARLEPLRREVEAMIAEGQG